MDMRDTILTFPTQLSEGIELGLQVRRDRPYRSIISCGMGGSAVAGEILSMVRDNVIVHWDYDLPANVGTQDLVVCTSWSGHTEETISSYLKARELSLETLVITDGNEIGQAARKDGTPMIDLPPMQAGPRCNVGYMTGALFGALGLHDQLPRDFDFPAIEQQAKELAEKIGGNTLSIYSSYPWRKLTGFWKMAYSENAKRQVFVNWFPSGAHNEIVGWEGPYRDTTSILLLRDAQEPDRYAKNFDASLAILEKNGYTVNTVTLSGDTLLEKVFNSYLLALLTSYHVAINLDIDPQATELLNEFKRLKSSI